jgi:hypothetical protein
MAQTRRKRQTKHRGNAAGVIESRGRTGRKPTAAEKRGAAEVAKAKSREQKVQDRRERPPTWRGAFYRAMLAALAFLAVLLIFKIGSSNQAIAWFPIVLVLYVPVSYYTDLWWYRRRQAKKAAGKEPSR